MAPREVSCTGVTAVTVCTVFPLMLVVVEHLFGTVVPAVNTWRQKRWDKHQLRQQVRSAMAADGNVSVYTSPSQRLPRDRSVADGLRSMLAVDSGGADSEAAAFGAAIGGASVSTGALLAS